MRNSDRKDWKKEKISGFWDSGEKCKGSLFQAKNRHMGVRSEIRAATPLAAR